MQRDDDSSRPGPGVGACLAAVLFLAVARADAWAAHPLLTDDAGTLGRGTRQIEVSGEFGREPERRLGQGGAVFTYGVTESFDAALTLPLQAVRPSGPDGGPWTGGLSDAVLEAKWRVAERRGLGLALKPSATLSTGDEERGFGSGRSTYRLAVLASAVRGRLEAHANAGYLFNDNRLGERVGLWHGSVAAGASVYKGLRVFVNAAADASRESGAAAPALSAVVGAVAPLGPGLDLDLGFKTGLNSAQPFTGLLVGATARF